MADRDEHAGALRVGDTSYGSSTKPYSLIPAGLIALSVIPVVAGTARLLDIAGRAEITEANARFVTAPLPVVPHILAVTIYCVVGAFQFLPGLRRSKPRWHRDAGRVLVPFGLLAALTGLWMTQFYRRSIPASCAISSAWQWAPPW